MFLLANVLYVGIFVLDKFLGFGNVRTQCSPTNYYFFWLLSLFLDFSILKLLSQFRVSFPNQVFIHVTYILGSIYFHVLDTGVSPFSSIIMIHPYGLDAVFAPRTRFWNDFVHSNFRNDVLNHICTIMNVKLIFRLAFGVKLQTFQIFDGSSQCVVFDFSEENIPPNLKFRGRIEVYDWKGI